MSVENSGYTGTVALSADRTQVDANEPSAQLTAEVSKPVVAPYALTIYDDTGARVGYCRPQWSPIESCSAGVSPENNASRTYTAYVAQDDPVPGPPSDDVRSASSLSISHLGYTGTVTLSADRTQVDADNPSANLTAEASKPVVSPYTLSIYDQTGALINSCTPGWYPVTSCTASATLHANSTRTYTAFVAQDIPQAGPPTDDTRAMSTPVLVSSWSHEDAIGGLSFVVISAALEARYGSIQHACLQLGTFVNTRILRGSASDLTLICNAHGVRAAVMAMVAAGGTTVAAATVFAWAFSDPSQCTSTNCTDEPAPSPSPGPGPVPAPVIPGQNERDLLSTHLQMDLNERAERLGTRRNPKPTPREFKVIAEACLSQAAQFGGGTARCFDETIFVPGRDALEAARNDLNAIMTGRPWRLNYVAGAVRATTLSRGWYNSRPECAERSIETPCDEYPFYTTNQAGPGARLTIVPKKQNEAEGHQLRWMPPTCKFTSGIPEEGVLGSPISSFPYQSRCRTRLTSVEMTMAPRADGAHLRGLLDELEGFWRTAGDPVVQHLAPGLSPDEVEIVSDLGLSLPEEAAVWWQWHNGAPAARPRADVSATPWMLISIHQAVDLYRENLDWARTARAETGSEDRVWPRRLFPIAFGGSGQQLAVDCSVPPGAPTPVCAAEILDESDFRPGAPSLTTVVGWWVDFHRQGIYRWTGSSWESGWEQIPPHIRRTGIV